MFDLLKDVRVVEAAMLFNGDQVGRALGDLGADVIKVETPGSGDYLRDFLGQITPHNSPAHLYANRNKRSIALDLKSPEGKYTFFELLKTADIFVDGFVAGACDRLGIGYEQQKRAKEDIVYVQSTGFGAEGPYASIPTHGQMQGGPTGGTPVEMGEDGLTRPSGQDGLADGTVVGPMFAALTALAALRKRDTTGQGAYIDVAGSDGVLSLFWFTAMYTWNDHLLTDRRGLSDPDAKVRFGHEGSAKYQFYESSDGKILLFCGIEHKFWDKFCAVIGRDDLKEHKNLNAPVDFGMEQLELRRTLQSVFHTKTWKEWIDLAIEHDLPIGPCHNMGDVPADPHNLSREVVYEDNHPSAGRVKHVSWPARIKDLPFSVYRPAPSLGQHTDEILRTLEIDEQRIAALREAKTI